VEASVARAKVDDKGLVEQYHPPMAHFELDYVDGKGWMLVRLQGGMRGVGDVLQVENKNVKTLESLPGWKKPSQQCAFGQ
jgi:hypothetical protein